MFKHSPSIPKTCAYKKTVENFEWSNILGLGMGEADANDDEGLEVVEEGQVRAPWLTGNIPN